MKRIIFAITALAILSVASGCALLMSSQDRVAGNVAKGVLEYCKNTDAKFRADLEAAINAKAAPNKVTLSCN